MARAAKRSRRDPGPTKFWRELELPKSEHVHAPIRPAPKTFPSATRILAKKWILSRLVERLMRDLVVVELINNVANGLEADDIGS